MTIEAQAPCIAYWLVREHVADDAPSPDVGMTLTVVSNIDQTTSVWELSAIAARYVAERLSTVRGVSVQLTPYDRGALEAG